MTIEFRPTTLSSTSKTEDIKKAFDDNDITAFLDSAFERNPKRITPQEYTFLLEFLTDHDPHTLTARDIYNLPNDEIYAIQKYFDEYNTSYIEAAYRQNLIRDEEYQSLYTIYNDGMRYYNQVYDICLELFSNHESTDKNEFTRYTTCRYTAGFDMSTGTVDRDEQGKTIDYSTKVLTPFVETRVKFTDTNGDPIYVLFPKIKASHRSIDKVIKEIGKQTRKDVAKATDRYFSNDYDDREEFFQQEVEPVLERDKNKAIELHDITRLTITCRYLSGISWLNSSLDTKQKKFNYKIDTPRNRFDDLPLYENPKAYFDTKIVITLLDDKGKPFDVEVQLKIDTLYRADIRTHKPYEKSRKIIESITDNDPNKESKLKQAAELDKQCRYINENAVHEYNMILFDDIQNTINSDLKHRRNINPNDDGSFDICNDTIFNDYLVSSYEAFDPRTFSPEHYTNGKPINKMGFLKLAGLLPKNFDEFAPGADEIVEQKFNAIYDKSNPQEYKNNHHLRTQFREILQVAQTYSDIINAKITNRIINDLAEAQASLIIDDKIVEKIIKDSSNDKTKDVTKKCLDSIPNQEKIFDPATPLGQICILKLLRRLPKSFPKKSNELKTADIQKAQEIYADIFRNPKDPNHDLLTRLLKIATKQQSDVQTLVDKKANDKMTKLISENVSQNNNTNIPLALMTAKQQSQKY